MNLNEEVELLKGVPIFSKVDRYSSVSNAWRQS